MLGFNKHRLQKGKKPRKAWQWFISGFFAILIVAGVFGVGYKFGNGSWSLGLGYRVSTANKTLPDSLDFTSVNEVYQALKQKYDGQLDVNKLMDGLKKGLVEAAGDPYTTYLDSSDAKSFNEQLSGSFTGIGAELGKQGNNIVVISPIAGFPAEKAGLKAKDVIVQINGQDASGLNIDEAVQRIRGDKGTTVKLTVIRNGTDKLDFTITRDVITIPSVTTKNLDGNIGYIQISRFAEDTASLTDTAAKDFKAKNVKGIILDLRNDPGGYLNAAVSVSSEWLKNGQLILQEKRDSTVIQSYSAQGNGQLVGVPTVVLINEGSASASEITAGALKDDGVAKVIGVISFGKGSVQDVTNFSGGDILKVTVARWFTPSGKNIDKQGIEPNIKVVLTDADISAGKDTQLLAAEAQLSQ
ncbi:MAG TPA: S41 family peptidase [Patescibacteria group bacterium]|nr:S41 family peptidase [Patescibacteria group bacterium]